MIDLVGPALRLRNEYKQRSSELIQTANHGPDREWRLLGQLDRAAQLLEAGGTEKAIQGLWEREYVRMRGLYLQGKGEDKGPNVRKAHCFTCGLELEKGEGERYEFYETSSGWFLVAVCVRHDPRYRHCMRCGWPIIQSRCAVCGLDVQGELLTIPVKMVAHGEPA